MKNKDLEARLKAIRNRGERDRAEMLSLEIGSFVQPILDFYQFKTENDLCRYIAEVCDIKGKITFSIVRHLVSGRIKYRSDQALEWTHSKMRRMKESAEGGFGEQISPEHRDKYLLPERESLQTIIEKGVKAFTGDENKKILMNVKASLDDDDLVKKPSVLLNNLLKEYGFVNPSKVNEFLAEAAGIPLTYQMLDMSGKRIPSNYHRKMFGVGQALLFAARDHKEMAVDVILGMSRERSLREGSHIVYLAVPKRDYSRLLSIYEDTHGIKGHALATLMSQITGMTIDNAKNVYLTGKAAFMDREYFRRLEWFEKDAMPNIAVIDLSDEEKREKINKKIRQFRKGSNVLVLYAGPIDDEATKMANHIKEFMDKRTIRTFVYDPRQTLRSELPSFEGMLDGTFYKRA